MASTRPIDDLAPELTAVVVEAHVEKLRAHARTLPRRALRAAAEYGPDIAESGGPERRPAEQPGTEDAKRYRNRKLSPEAREGGNRQGDDTAADLDGAREH